MEIRTKFDVGDSLYVIDYDSEEGEWYVVKGMLKVFKIIATFYNNVRNVEYFFYELYGQLVSEGNCFWTEKEAQKECDKRNGKI